MSVNKGPLLLNIARASITEKFDQSNGKSNTINEKMLQDTDWLQEKGACFITLMQSDNLRGCVGTLEAHRSLLADVRANAKAAAFKDTRFSPLSRDELATTQIEVSLLSVMQALSYDNEQDALNQLQPGIDGVVFEFGQQRSTFLPQVWQQLPAASDFMTHLKQKAGLPADFWADEVKLFRYSVSKYRESDVETIYDVNTEVMR